LEILEKIYRFLISRQFAVWSLILLAAVFIVSGTLPNFSTLTDREFAELKESRPILHWISSHLQIYQLIRSPLFLILPGAIWLSTALCMIRRLRREIPRGVRSLRARETDFGDETSATIDRPISLVVERISGVLRGRRWQAEEVAENGAVQYFAQKGAQGFWGSVVFHLSMLVFLIGIIASILGRFDAEMILTEGQTFPITEDQMLRINGQGTLSPKLPGTLVSLDRFESSFVQGKYPVDYAAHLSLMDGPLSIRKDTVRVNKPLKHDRWQIFLHRYGFAPRFEIWDIHGKLLFDSFVNLVFTTTEQTDHFDVPHAPLRLEAQIVPERGNQGDSAASRELTTENPRLRINTIANGESIGEHEVVLGDTANFGAYVIRFAEMRQWAWFGIVYDPGYGLIIIAFTLCVAGLAHRFVFTEKWLQVKVEERGDTAIVSLAGRSRYFPALFEKEMEDVRNQLTAEAIATEANGGDGG
jgi:cytochrome c biogenesis protein ResB